MIFAFITLFILIKSTEMPLHSKILHMGKSENTDEHNWFLYDSPFLPIYETTHRLIRKKHHKLKHLRNNGEIHLKSGTLGDWYISGHSRQKHAKKLKYAIPSSKRGYRRTFGKSGFKVYPHFQLFSKQQFFKKTKASNIPVIKNYEAFYSRVTPKYLFPDLDRTNKFKSNIRLRTASQKNDEDIFEDGQINNESNVTTLNESKNFPFPVVKMATAKPLQNFASMEKSGYPFLQQVPLDSSIFEIPESKESAINNQNFNRTPFLPSSLFPQLPSIPLNESIKLQTFLAPNSSFQSPFLSHQKLGQNLQQKETMNQSNIIPENIEGLDKINQQFLPFLFPITNTTYPNSSGVFMMQALPFINDSKNIHLPLFNSEQNITFNPPFLQEQGGGINTEPFSSNEQKMLPGNMNQMFQQTIPSQNTNHMFEQEAVFQGNPENIQSYVTNLPEGNKELQLAFPSFGNSSMIFQQVPATLKGQNMTNNFFKYQYKTASFTDTSSMVVSLTTLSPLQYLHSKLKEIKKIHSRFGRKGRILVASVAAVLVSITVILIIISTCKDYKDKKKKKYPFKKKNTFTLLRATMEQQKELLRKISTLKYDNLNAEEEVEQ